MGNSGRENITNLPEDICKTFAELAAARKMSKKQLFIALVSEEAERREELLRIHRQQIALEGKAKTLRQCNELPYINYIGFTDDSSRFYRNNIKTGLQQTMPKNDKRK